MNTVWKVSSMLRACQTRLDPTNENLLFDSSERRNGPQQ